MEWLCNNQNSKDYEYWVTKLDTKRLMGWQAQNYYGLNDQCLHKKGLPLYEKPFLSGDAMMSYRSARPHRHR